MAWFRFKFNYTHGAFDLDEVTAYAVGPGSSAVVYLRGGAAIHVNGKSLDAFLQEIKKLHPDCAPQKPEAAESPQPEAVASP